MPGLRMTVGVLAVLGALLDRSDTELYGLEIVRASGLEPGTIYPILQRLRAAAWVSDRWEDAEPAHTEGRPPRRYYRLTTEGRARAIHALQHGRDRSGLGRLLAPPRLPAVPSSEALATIPICCGEKSCLPEAASTGGRVNRSIAR